MAQGTVICITGIDTDIGKTIATGLVARFLMKQGLRVITQKICQTGCEKFSADIRIHRRIMGIDLLDDDRDGLTCPYIFMEPCSPHLAARLEGKRIDLDVISTSTKELISRYDVVLLEGVGGLNVPLLEDYTLLDYIEEKKYPQILVSCAKLGSINHTLSALEILKGRSLELLGILYNRFMDTNDTIAEDSRAIFSRYLIGLGFQDVVVDMLPIDSPDNPDSPEIDHVYDFSPFFKTIDLHSERKCIR